MGFASHDLIFLGKHFLEKMGDYEVGLLPAKVKPVNCPWIGWIGTIEVLRSGRDDEEMICLDRQVETIDGSTSPTFDAMNQYMFICPFGTVSVVVFGLWVKANIGNVKFPGKERVPVLINDFRRNDDGLFSFKSFFLSNHKLV